MTRTAVRHIASALAAMALVSAIAGSPASAAKSGNGWGEIRLAKINAGGTDMNRLGSSGSRKGLATKKPGKTRPLPYIAAPFTGGLSSISGAGTTDTRK